MKRNFFFVLIAALLLAPWPIVYAYDGVKADSNTPDIQPADPANGPQLQASGDATGHMTPGDLFTVDTTGNKADKNYELVISNADELAADYRFMNLKVGIFVQGADAQHWTRLTAVNGEELHDIYITMYNGKVDFSLPGGAIYKIVIDTGCFYSYGAAEGDVISTPEFYLSAN